VFSELVMTRFGKDHHELLLRQLFQIRQTGTVDEFIEQFSAIVDQLGAYHKTTDPLFYSMHFIDGLKDPIRAAVSLHRPQNWDTACVLAKLQEDLSVPRKPEVRKWDVSSGTRPFARTALPLPPPIPRPAVDPKLPVEAGRSTSADEHWAALRSSRRAQGLCIHCGAKWSRDHRCAQVVHLNSLEELLALFSEDDIDADTEHSEHDHNEVQMMLSVAMVSSISSALSMSFEGQLGDTPIRILLDSGSTHTFISTSVAASCSELQTLQFPVQVMVANGQVLTCTQFAPAAVWSIQGLEFQSDLKVIPLSYYDMILVMDWLTSHSPTKIHWAHQWLQIPYQQTTVQLTGTLSSLPEGTILQLCSVETLEQPPSLEVPPDVQQLLQHYASLFEQPSKLPPSRVCDHAIPLIPGAGPIFSWPYRFAPAIKDQIEKQV